MQFWKFQTCPKTWKIGMHFSFNIPVTMQFQKFCRPAPDIRVHRAGSQLKMSESQTKAGNQRKFENFWKFENLQF